MKFVFAPISSATLVSQIQISSTTSPARVP